VSGGLQLDEIVARLGGVLQGDGSLVVSQVGSLLSAGQGQIAFLASAKYREQLQRTQAAAVIVPPQFADDTRCRASFTRTPTPTTRGSWRCSIRRRKAGPVCIPARWSIRHCRHRSVSAKTPWLAKVRIGENVTLYPGCVLGDGCRLATIPCSTRMWSCMTTA
jgi:UDP-3-O-[3-hydroxymyristoyl] glucosamine N-acyltransferase